MEIVQHCRLRWLVAMCAHRDEHLESETLAAVNWCHGRGGLTFDMNDAERTVAKPLRGVLALVATLVAPLLR